MAQDPSSSSSVQRLSERPSGVASEQSRATQALGNSIIMVAFHEHSAEKDASSGSETDVPAPRTKKRQRAGKKSSGACVHCKSLKVKCQFPPGESQCERCVAGGHQCLSRVRKKRKEAPTHEDLRQQSRQQDLQIQSLLEQFDQLNTDTKVRKWVEQAQQLNKLTINERIARPVAPVTCHYYSSLIGPLDVDLSPTAANYSKIPMILRSGVVDPREVIDLFNLYFERINPFFSLLDGELHCPQRMMWTSPLLFTVVCACAARHYNRQGLWALAIEIAQDSAAQALISGPRTVETVQSLLILAVYPVPKKKWLEDKSWLFMGAAIRMAQEIGLDKPPTGTDIRENLNRTRTWINTFCVDGSHATQFGKMPMVQLNDYLVRKSVRTWYTSLDSAPYDIGLCAYAELLLHMIQYRRGMGPQDVLQQRLKEGFNVVAHCIQFDKDFTALAEFWTKRLDADPNVKLCPVVRYRAHNFRMVASYLRLVILSAGFQYSLKRGLSRDDYILQQSIEVAQSGIQTVIDLLFPSGLLSWAMDANFLYMAFCAGFLLNLIRPKLLPLLTPIQCGRIVNLVKNLIDILGSDAVALDGRHSPAIYHRFLSALLDKYYTPSLQSDISPAEIYPQYRENREITPPYAFLWPDIPSQEGTPVPEVEQPVVHATHKVREQAGEAEMDFSISHFVQSTMLPVLGEASTMTVPPASSTGMFNESFDAARHWQEPFNFASILDIMYATSQVENH